MGIFSKIKNKIKKAIPKEIAPFLPALASIYGGPMLASMFGGLNPMLAQGLGAALADAGTQELTSDRTRLESSLFSGIMGAARGMTPDASLMTDGPKGRALTGPQTAGGSSFAPAEKILKSGDAYKAAFKNLGTGQKMMEGARSFAMAPLDNPFSMASASAIGVQAAPKLGYNEVERLNRELAANAAEIARQQGLSYEESLGYARNYYFGSNPDASEEDFNSFMDYYNSDLNNPSLANGGRVGFANGTSMPPGKPGALDSIDNIGLNMQAFYDEYPETQVGSYINENRYKSEKIEKLETKLNEIIDMRQRTADRSRNPENDGMPSLMEKLLDKEINSLYADRTNDDIRKSEAQKRDEMNARFAEENAKKQQMIQDYYNNLGVYARPGRAMGGMMSAGMMDRPNFNYGSGRQTPQGDPIAPNVPPGMQMDLRQGGFIELGTKPRADDVPAMVGKDEFVLNDRAVAGIGKALTGRADPRAGARALYDLQSQMEATV